MEAAKVELGRHEAMVGASVRRRVGDTLLRIGFKVERLFASTPPHHLLIASFCYRPLVASSSRLLLLRFGFKAADISLKWDSNRDGRVDKAEVSLLLLSRCSSFA